MKNETIIASNLGGKEYIALNSKLVKSPRNEYICDIAETTDIFQINSWFESMQYGAEMLSGLDYGEMLKIIRNALRHFQKEIAAGNSLDDLLKKISLNSGLNKKTIFDHNIEPILNFFSNNTIKNFQDRFPLFNYVTDQKRKTSIARTVLFFNDTRYPIVNAYWLFLLLLKIPLVLISTRKEPLFISELVNALYKAGLPEKSLYFLPVSENYLNHYTANLFNEKKTVYASDDPTVSTLFSSNSTGHCLLEPIDIFIELERTDTIDNISKRIATLFVTGMSNGICSVRNVFINNYEAEFTESLSKHVMKGFNNSSSSSNEVFDIKKARNMNSKFKSLSFDFTDLTSYYYSKNIIFKKDKAVTSPYYFRPVVLLTSKYFNFDADMAFPYITVKKVRQNEFTVFAAKNKLKTAVIESDSKELINGFQRVDSLKTLIKGIPCFDTVMASKINSQLKSVIADELMVAKG